MGYRAFKCVSIDSSSHLGRNRPFIVLIDTQWTLLEVAGCARSAPDQDRRLVLGALEAKNNHCGALERVSNVSSSNLGLMGYL